MIVNHPASTPASDNRSRRSERTQTINNYTNGESDVKPESLYPTAYNMPAAGNQKEKFQSSPGNGDHAAPKAGFLKRYIYNFKNYKSLSSKEKFQFTVSSIIIYLGFSLIMLSGFVLYFEVRDALEDYHYYVYADSTDSYQKPLALNSGVYTATEAPSPYSPQLVESEWEGGLAFKSQMADLIAGYNLEVAEDFSSSTYASYSSISQEQATLSMSSFEVIQRGGLGGIPVSRYVYYYKIANTKVAYITIDVENTTNHIQGMVYGLDPGFLHNIRGFELSNYTAFIPSRWFCALSGFSQENFITMLTSAIEGERKYQDGIVLVSGMDEYNNVVTKMFAMTSEFYEKVRNGDPEGLIEKSYQIANHSEPQPTDDSEPPNNGINWDNWDFPPPAN